VLTVAREGSAFRAGMAARDQTRWL
jgi:hypothetical protein